MDKNAIAVNVFNKLAKEYQNKFMDVSAYCSSFDIFCSSIKKKNAEILELACGPGNITRYLLHKRPDFKILGTDLSSNMIGLAAINNPTADFKIMDCRDAGSIDKQYDAVMCGFCLPYLSKTEAVKLIADVSQILKPGGVLYISTMEDDHLKSGFEKGSAGDEIYMNYHEAGYLTEALNLNGFKIFSLERKDIPKQGAAKAADLILIAVKN